MVNKTYPANLLFIMTKIMGGAVKNIAKSADRYQVQAAHVLEFQVSVYVSINIKFFHHYPLHILVSPSTELYIGPFPIIGNIFQKKKSITI